MEGANLRNNQCFMYISVRGNHNSSTEPYVSISRPLSKFLSTFGNMTIMQFVHKAEVFALQGTRGLGMSTAQAEKQMKKETVAAIKISLSAPYILPSRYMLLTASCRRNHQRSQCQSELQELGHRHGTLLWGQVSRLPFSNTQKPFRNDSR